MKSVNVLVVDDSAMVRKVISLILEQEKSVRFNVTTATDPVIAINKMKKMRPDVIVLDLEMPRMDGLTFLEKLMAKSAVPVVICSGYAEKGNVKALKALEMGAVDIITKPKLGVQEFLYESAVTLVDTVRAASQAKVNGAAHHATNTRPPEPVANTLPAQPEHLPSTHRIIAVGASTGGTEAIQMLLQAMPQNAPGIVIVQHMPEGFTRAFAQRLNQICRIEVKEAEEGDEILPGRAIISPGNRHLSLSRSNGNYFVELSSGPLVSRHRPSVDVLFKSVAKTAGKYAVGVIMTGMGSDGAEGLLEIRKAGGHTIAQNEASSVVFGMPKEAINIGAAKEILPLGLIPAAVLKN